MKNYFYRIEPMEILAEMICIPESERGQWSVTFFRELSKGDPDAVTIPIVARVIKEAMAYREKLSANGRNGGLAKAKQGHSKAIARLKPGQAIAKQGCSPALANSSNNNNKKEYVEAVSMTEKEYQSLVGKYGEVFTAMCLEKLSNAKLANTKLKYDSDYRAILKWVVEAVQKSLPQSKPTPETNPLCVTPSWH